MGIETVETRESSRTRANSDNRMLYEAAALIREFRPDVLVIGSGDGDLTTDLARFVREESQTPLVLTMSVPGSVSSRLDAATNPNIWGNILIGEDCLRPMTGEFTRSTAFAGAATRLHDAAPPSTNGSHNSPKNGAHNQGDNTANSGANHGSKRGNNRGAGAGKGPLTEIVCQQQPPRNRADLDKDRISVARSAKSQ